MNQNDIQELHARFALYTKEQILFGACVAIDKLRSENRFWKYASIFFLATSLFFLFFPMSAKAAEPGLEAAKAQGGYISTNAGVNSSCSATWVAPSVVLTATHCFNGKEKPSYFHFGDYVYTVERRVDDLTDHTLLVVQEETFDMPKKFVKFCAPISGEEVVIKGNPAGWNDVYRFGRTIKVHNLYTAYDLNVFYGDSGSGVFSLDRGCMVAVISEVFQPTLGGVSLKFAKSNAFSFTREQIALAFGE